MAKKAIKKVGLFSIETTSDKMIQLHNGCRLMLTMDANNPERIKSIRYIDNRGNEFSMPAANLVQAALVATEIDRTCRYVCGYHGSFVTPDFHQVPGCPHCHKSTVDRSIAMMNSSGMFEETDA